MDSKALSGALVVATMATIAVIISIVALVAPPKVPECSDVEERNGVPVFECRAVN